MVYFNLGHSFVTLFAAIHMIRRGNMEGLRETKAIQLDGLYMRGKNNSIKPVSPSGKKNIRPIFVDDI